MILPSFITKINEAFRIVESLCATIKLVLPFISLSNASCTCSSVRVSILDVASSKISIGGRQSMTLVIHRSCFCPWLMLSSWSTVSRPFGSLRMNSQLLASFAARMISSSVASGFPNQMLSLTVPLLIQVSCSTMPKLLLSACLDTSRMSFPSTRIFPSSTS